MPVVASGNQKVELDKILPAIVEAAIFWLENGLPLKSIKLVLYSDEQVAEGLSLFKKMKEEYEFSTQEKIDNDLRSAKSNITKSNNKKGSGWNRGIEPMKGFSVESFDDSQSGATKSSRPVPASPLSSAKTENYDFFISYAHTHSELIDRFVEQLKKANSKIKVFYDKDSIPPGGMWIKQISDTIGKSKKVLVFLSPDYDNSPVCWDEFQCAKLLEYNRKTSVIQTIYLYKHEIPLIMGIYSYLDCREGDLEKLFEAIPKLIS
jgi:hypothetical protein